MLETKSIYQIFFLITLSILIRLYGITDPLTDMQYWRQTDTASIAQNFYEEGMNILYPRVNWRGDSKGYVESEFPVYPFSVALLYKLSGKVNDSFGRIVSLIFLLFSVIVIYKFAFRLFDRKTAFYSALFFTLSPLTIFYGRTFMPESVMIFFYISSLYFFYMWINIGGKKYWISGVVAAAMAVLIKLTAIFVFIPIAAIVYDKYKKDFFKKNYVLLFFFLSLIPSLLWYFHAYKLFLETNLSFGILSGNGYDKFLNKELLFGFELWNRLFFRIFGIILTPVGGTFFLLSLFTGIINKEIIRGHNFLWAWLFSILLYIIIVAEGNRLLDYYQIFLVPVAGIFITRLVCYIELKISADLKGYNGYFCNFIYFSILISSFFFLINYFEPGDYTKQSYEFARVIKGLTPEKSLFIVVDSEGNDNEKWYRGMKGRIHRPSLLYYTERKGWEFLPYELSEMEVSEFDSLIKKGAEYFIIPKIVLKKFDGLKKFIDKRGFSKVKENDWFDLYRLSLNNK